MPKRLRVVLQQLGQRRVERPVQPLDALEGGADRQPLAIDLLGIGDDAGDGAEPAHHARRLGVGELRQPAGEQLGIELVGLAIDVEIGAREACRDQRRAERHDRLEQLVDVAILGLAQGVRIEPGGLQEGLGVDAARMRRAEHDRRQLLVGPQQACRAVSARQGSRRVHRRACRFGMVLGALRDSAGDEPHAARDVRCRGHRRPRLCQAASGLSIGPVPHVVEDFRRSSRRPSRYFIARLPN